MIVKGEALMSHLFIVASLRPILKVSIVKKRRQRMDFTEKLRLREKAIEDLYFAEVDKS